MGSRKCPEDLNQDPDYVLPTKSQGWPDFGQTTALHSHTLYQYSIVQVADEESLIMARRLVRELGILVGGSTGSAVLGAAPGLT